MHALRDRIKLLSPAERDRRRRQSRLPSEESTASFWHSQPSQFLLQHRTTPELPNEADIVIMGSGITGTSCAHFVLNDPRSHGLSVVMLDAREACWGATGRNGGHCRPELANGDPNVSAFELLNYEALEDFVRENDIPCEWRWLPACRTYFGREMLDQDLEYLENIRAVNPALAEHVRVVTKQDDLERLLVPNAVGALITDKAASLWPYKLITWTLEQLIQKCGLNLQTNTPVQSMEHAKNAWYLKTPRGSINAKNVIIATNGYTSNILPELTDIVRPVQGQMAALLPKPQISQLRHSYQYHQGYGIDYLIQRPVISSDPESGHLVFGGGRTRARNNGEGIGDDSYLPKTMKLPYTDGSTMTNSDMRQGPTHEWTGIMGFSSDCWPWVGSVPHRPGIWLSAAYAGHGMPCAWLCGRAISMMLLASNRGEDVKAIERELIESNCLPAKYFDNPRALSEGEGQSDVRS